MHNKLNYIEKYDVIANKLLQFLAKKQNNDGTFPGETYYGETFAILAWSFDYNKYKKNIDKAIIAYGKKKRDSNFHWEFNNYALLEYHSMYGDKSILKYITKLKFKYLKSTNWTLLRATCKILNNSDIKKAISEIDYALSFQDDSGLIWDHKKSKSIQYHIFSAALLGEISEKTKDKNIKNHFLEAARFVHKLILKNGDSVYIGRGQEQLFGYGALLYVLEMAEKYIQNGIFRSDGIRVINFISNYARKNGSFPLVLRKEEKGFPKKINVNNIRYLGWYPYNNYFDYLPFFAYYLFKTRSILTSATKKVNIKSRLNLNNDEFIIFKNINYEAIISRPFGQMSNDMPVPYICYKNFSFMPCYGGPTQYKLYFIKNFFIKLGLIDKAKDTKIKFYSKEALALPYWKEKNKISYLRDCPSRITKNFLIFSAPFLRFERNFNFLDKSIKINDKIIITKNTNLGWIYLINYFFLRVKKLTNNKLTLLNENDKIIAEVQFSNKIKINKKSFYCAKGPLVNIYEKLENIKLLKGNIFERKATIFLK